MIQVEVAGKGEGRHLGRQGRRRQPASSKRQRERHTKRTTHNTNTTHNDTHTLHYTSSVPTYLGRAPYPPTTYQ